VVIADPARSGLGRPGAAALVRAGAPVLVLVSCDPASLGRDAKLLDEAGYRHERSEVLDTFPHTTHIEVVSRFARV
jgi:23S rRNA (uracil1939-C5)-methyltransferase